MFNLANFSKGKNKRAEIGLYAGPQTLFDSSSDPPFPGGVETVGWMVTMVGMVMMFQQVHVNCHRYEYELTVFESPLERCHHNHHRHHGTGS
jgi:hypothetical protein